jgi:6-pyruvoyl-tetrahydropterin synthase
MYQVIISKGFTARQGLKSPVRASKGLAGLVPEEGFRVLLNIAVSFDDSQINERGWFVDTDAIEDAMSSWTSHLSSEKWTDLFEFRPTFERVAEASYKELSLKIPQLNYVELDNETINVKTRYQSQTLA